MEDLLQRIQRAGSDVTVDDTQGAESDDREILVAAVRHGLCFDAQGAGDIVQPGSLCFLYTSLAYGTNRYPTPVSVTRWRGSDGLTSIFFRKPPMKTRRYWVSVS